MASRIVLAASIALLTLIAGCVGAVQPAPVSSAAGQTAPDDAGNATISVSADAAVSAAPDVALVRVAVVATAPTAEAARAQVAENVSAMRDGIRGTGVPDDAVQTTYYNLHAVYERTGGDREVVRYRAAHGFEIEADVSAAGTVIDAAVENGANQVEGVQFTLAEPTRRDLRADALGLAMANARGDAEAIANASGLSIVGVRSASTADYGAIPVEAPLERGVGGDAPTVIEPGPVTVSASVSVTYRAA